MKSNGWPMVPLGEVLRRSDDWISIDPQISYREVTVRLWGKGVTARRECLGAEIKSNRRLRVRRGQFIASRIDARNGAFGLIPNELDGAVVTNDFPVFVPDRARLYVPFLDWLSKTHKFIDLCKAASEGTTNRVRLKEDRFLAALISLPPIEEQQRIVGRVAAIAAKVETAHRLRDEADVAADAIYESGLARVFDKLTATSPAVRFREVCSVVRGGSPRPAGSPVYYDGDIPFLKVGDLTADDTKYVERHTSTIKPEGLARTRYVEPNTLMLTNSGATLGVPKICRFKTTFNDGIQAFLGLPDDLNKEYLYYFLRGKTRWFRDWAARGQGQPNLNTEMVKELEFPRCGAADQRRVVAYFDSLSAETESLKSVQRQSAAELDALMPSILDKAFKGELIPAGSSI